LKLFRVKPRKSSLTSSVFCILGSTRKSDRDSYRLAGLYSQQIATRSVEPHLGRYREHWTDEEYWMLRTLETFITWNSTRNGLGSWAHESFHKLTVKIPRQFDEETFLLLLFVPMPCERWVFPPLFLKSRIWLILAIFPFVVWNPRATLILACFSYGVVFLN